VGVSVQQQRGLSHCSKSCGARSLQLSAAKLGGFADLRPDRDPSKATGMTEAIIAAMAA
jgi:hypothetical protein